VFLQAHFEFRSQARKNVIEAWVLCRIALSLLQTVQVQCSNQLGPVVQKWVSANPGLKFNLLF
jgi:hypothetical protein